MVAILVQKYRAEDKQEKKLAMVVAVMLLHTYQNSQMPNRPYLVGGLSVRFRGWVDKT